LKGNNNTRTISEIQWRFSKTWPPKFVRLHNTTRFFSSLCTTNLRAVSTIFQHNLLNGRRKLHFLPSSTGHFCFL
jgi:hypothetical protein